MPFPGNKVANGDTNFTGRLSSNYSKTYVKKIVILFWYFGPKMENEFKDHLEKFISLLFPHGMV